MSTTPKSPSPLRNHFNTLPSRLSSHNVLQIPQQPTPISRLPIPRSQSTSSLHDLVSDLKQQQRQQRDQEEEKRKLEASKNSLSRHASAVVRYYNKAKSRSPSLSRALSSTPKKTKPKPQSPLPQLPAQPPPEPRLQRADSRVRIHAAPAPLIEPSAAVIEEVVLPPVVTDIAKIEDPEVAEQQEQHEQQQKQREEKVELDEKEHGEKVELVQEEPKEALERLQPAGGAEPRRQTPMRSLSSPPAHNSWQSIRFLEADEWVQNGIQYHERGELEQATLEFQRAAKAELPLGMFLYGLSLRHGWGCKRSERTAFRYLQKSAEHAIFDLQTFLSGRGSKLIANRELVLAIYELGVSSRHGWGCPKDKKQAFYFFKIAADLGDADAQNELAQCYHHGNGVKKNMTLAAKYYRKADRQGRGIVGNSWIYKNKYGDS